MTREPFGARLARAMRQRGPLCVGIDPHPGLLAAWGLPDDVEGLEAFALAVVDALADRVAVLKPQVAFFERHGSAGVAVLERVLSAAGAAGALTIADAKRGDIGSTMEAYADAYLGAASPLRADAVTVSPFLGVASLAPVFERARTTGRGAFVLALTSNPEGAQVQHARGGDGRSVAEVVLDGVRAENVADGAGTAATGMGSFGVVVGATVGTSASGAIGAATPTGSAPGPRLDVGGPILAPGLGAQGAAPADLPAVFGPALPRVLPSASREVLHAGVGNAGVHARSQALRDAADRLLDAVTAALAAARRSV